VVTKADLGQVATRSRRDLSQALKALGNSHVPVLSVSSMPPPSGISELSEAIDQHRAGLDVPASRQRARRRAALRELVAEHGDAGLRALGGRREAERFLADQDPALGVTELVAALAARAQ
jgi:LAO/AO transport system kinase